MSLMILFLDGMRFVGDPQALGISLEKIVYVSGQLTTFLLFTSLVIITGFYKVRRLTK